MGYRILYGTSRFDRIHKISGKVISAVSLLALAAVITLCVIFPQEISSLRDRLFPVFSPSVREAYSDMTQDISEGVSPYDAAVTFCREVLFETSG